LCGLWGVPWSLSPRSLGRFMWLWGDGGMRLCKDEGCEGADVVYGRRREG